MSLSERRESAKVLLCMFPVDILRKSLFWKRQHHGDSKKKYVQEFGRWEWTGGAQQAFRVVKVFYTMLQQWTHSILYPLKPKEGTAPRVSSNDHCRVWVRQANLSGLLADSSLVGREYQW